MGARERFVCLLRVAFPDSSTDVTWLHTGAVGCFEAAAVCAAVAAATAAAAASAVLPGSAAATPVPNGRLAVLPSSAAATAEINAIDTASRCMSRPHLRVRG